MNPDQSAALQHLRPWQDAMQALEEQLQALIHLLDCHPESPLITAIHALQGLATRQTAALAGTTDDWLEAWWLEADFGANPLKAGLVGEPLRTITMLEELVALVIDDLQAKKKEHTQ